MVCYRIGDPFALHHISRALQRRMIPDRCLKAHARSLCAGEDLNCVREVLIPTLLTVVMILINVGISSDSTKAVGRFPSHNFSFTNFRPATTKPILATPDLQFTYDVMDKVTRLLNVTQRYVVKENLMSRSVTGEQMEKPRVADVGVEFLWKNTSTGLEVDGYVLRLPYEMVKDVVPGCVSMKHAWKCGRNGDGLSAECPGSQSLISGLLSLQWSVETALIQTFKDADFEPPDLQIQMMPVPAYRPGATRTQLLVCLSMMIALCPLAFYIAVASVTEKKTGSKVMFKVMGVSDSVFWASWWLPYMLTVMLVSVIATILMALAGFLGSAGLAFFFLLALLYGASLLGIGSVISIFFNSSKTAGLVSCLVCILLGLLYQSVSLTRPAVVTNAAPTDMTESPVAYGAYVLSLFSPVAFTLGLDQAMFDHEQGAHSHIMAGQFPLLAALLMLLADTILYWLLALYLDIVMPSHYRLPHKPWFFVTHSYWCPPRDGDREYDVIPSGTPEGPHIEPMVDSMVDYKAIRIRDISKKFDNRKREPVYGLNGLDLDIYEGQITCVLGHPGAGKTTLMNILAGVMPPTSGAAFIYDLNASRNQDHEDMAQTVSYCPQQDVIRDHFTVEEHLRITAILRNNTEQEITSLLSDLHLEKHRHRMTRELSGCQKRRLSLALALLSDTKVLLLDEPTLGMDPEERRHVWQLLHARKVSRVIIFTSRRMDEADYFADRIVVLSTGRLRCVGSPLFLKQHFNVGYQLHVTVRPATSTDRLMRAVRTYVRRANLVCCEDNKLLITIPLQQAAKLAGLFKKLESKDRGADYLGITDFGVTMTTLEQIFWKLETEVLEKKVAEEEEAGNVFISPLLTPSEDTFTGYDYDRPDINGRGPSYLPSLSRSVTSPQLDDLSRRLSLFPPRHLTHQENNDGGSRRKSALPRMQRADMRKRSASEEARTHSSPGTRRLSGLFTKSTPHNRTRHSSEGGGHHGHSTQGAKSRRATIFADAFMKRRKENPRSPGLGPLRKSHTSGTLDTMAESFELQDRAEDRPAFNGTLFPTSLADRRATVAAYKDFRKSVSVHSNLSSLGTLNEQLHMPPDPMAKLNLLDTYEYARTTSLSDGSSSPRGIPSTSSFVEETVFFRQDSAVDLEKTAPGRPAKIGEVLANLTPGETGIGLELQRLRAMLKLRVSVCVYAKCWLLLRLLAPVMLALLAMGLSYATDPLKPSPPQLGKRIELFGIDHLLYRNQSGGKVGRLLSQFSRALEGPERVSLYTLGLRMPARRVDSVLDVLRQDGSAYKLHHNASCGLALPHLMSFLAHIMRDSPTPTPLNRHNQAFLAPRVSGWLLPWPPEDRMQTSRAWDWPPILFLGLALLVSTGHFAARILQERQDKLRSYLGVAGVSRLLYYGSAFIVDVVELIIPAVIIIIICAVSKMSMFEAEGAVQSLALLLILSVPVGVLWAYLASFTFTRPSTCRYLLPLLLILVTVSQFFLVHFLDKEDTERTATILHCVFTVLWPPYIRFGALHYIAKTGNSVVPDPPVSDFFRFESSVTICFIMLLVDIIILSSLVLMMDKLTFRPPASLSCSHKADQSSPVDHTHGDDEGVTSEFQHVQNLREDKEKGGRSWPWLVVEGVSRIFGSNRHQLRAVNNATFTVNKEEVLAILGPRESGKSTLLNAVLGLDVSSRGLIYLDSEKVDRSQWSEWTSEISYCPQYNPLWDCLTVDHHIDLIGRIKGLHPDDIHSFRESLYHDLDLDMYRSQRIAQISQCEKRKLSFAMSMLGQQGIMLLDEPSTGMEPRSQRLYWDAVNHFVRCSQRGAVITTHNVEEAKALCSRLGVFVNGQLRCLGTTEELKTRYRQTYTLEVTLRAWEENNFQQRMDMLILFLRELFPGLRMVEQFHHRAVFIVQCDAPDFTLAKTFDTLETLKRNLDLEDFTFSQSTLEQIYMDLARQQREGESKYTDLTNSGPTTVMPPPPTENTQSEQLSPTDPKVGVTNADPASQTRDAEDEGGASCQDSICDADAAVGIVIVHHNGDDNGGGVAGVQEGGAMEVGAAAPVVFTLDGVDNLAFSSDRDDAHEPQTSL